MNTSVAERDVSVADRVQNEIDRAIQRNIKGLEFLRSPGPAMGLTPKDVIYKKGTLNLYHYHPMADELYRVPVLFVMAPTNRSAILDLAPGQSLVEFLLKRGFDVYVMDWTTPRPEEKRLRIEDYTQDFIPECIRRVQAESGEKDVNVVGYCAGGILSCTYAATHPKGPLKNLACFTTPIDFEHMGLFKTWTDPQHFDVDRVVDTFGIIPGEVTNAAFTMLRPAARVAGLINVWDNMWNDEYVKQYRMFDNWATDQVPLPGEYMRQMVKELMWGNKLYKGELKIGGRDVKLQNIKVPLLHIVAEHDHIAPYDATKALVQLVGSQDKEEVVLKGGHVSVIAGPNAVKRMWPKLESWLAERST
jgi:polyhydroxyalkanoate synthase